MLSFTKSRQAGKNLFLLFVAFLSLQSSSNAQQLNNLSKNPYADVNEYSIFSSDVDTAWVSHYASGLLSGEDNANAIAVDNDGNIFVTGNSATVKYNPSGVEQWVVQESGNAIAVDVSGNVYIIGSGATIKYNSSGIEQWVVQGVDPYGRNWVDLAVDEAGNVYVTGSSEGGYVTIKYNSSGVEQWESRYDALEDLPDEATALALDDNGNVYVTGSIGRHGSRGGSYREGYGTVKYNTFGVEQWAVQYTEPSRDNDHRASDIVVDEAGNVYMTGGVVDSITGCDYTTIKYSASGVEQWVAIYNGYENSWDRPTALALDDDGNIFVTGNSATVKYNPSGVEQWVVQESGNALAIDHFSYVYVTAHKDDNYATFKYSSSGVEQWRVYYNGTANGNDEPTALALDYNGNVIVTGSSDGAGTADYVTIKYNPTGEEQCVSRYNSSGFSSDLANAIAVDNSENVYVTGRSESPISGRDYVTIKYNAIGEEQWRARYNGPGNRKDEAIAVALDVSGNVYVTGNSRTDTDYDFATVKYNANGELLWVARYNGSGNWETRGVEALGVDSFGNSYITGSLGFDYITIKYNIQGEEQWVAVFDGPGNANNEATALAVDNSGNVFVTGKSNDDYVTIKYNSSGEEQWVSYCYGETTWDYPTAIALDGSGNIFVTGNKTIKYNSSGQEQWGVGFYNGAKDMALDSFDNVYVTGYRNPFNFTGENYVTIKYNSSGQEQWKAIYDFWRGGYGYSHDEAYAIFVDSRGSAYVTGSSNGWGGFHDYDYATIKYNTFGEEQWVTRYNDGKPTDIVGDGSGNIYVTGSTLRRYTTIKYIEVPVSVVGEQEITPDAYNLSQNYPNPFNPTTTIKYQTPEISFVTIKVYDVLGGKVVTLVNEEKQTGTYEITWHAEDLPSGVYFYRLQAGSYIETKKMILLK